ncbi:MAG TPA: tRNA pseudouridine(38-40) synthase TruA [Pyrinomonadaceae bacterium]|nr:tRNA pseudouridine(38-40) synthase TruA [Pyrinomonadaceae bacterium]
MNYRLTIQYDGTDFHGWQMQGAGERTVQGELARALSLIDGRAVVVNGAGRTDAGVHAEGQVASVELARDIAPEKLRAAVNGNIEPDARVIAADAADENFHARYSARGKTYRYRIFNAPFASPFLSRFAHTDARRIDVRRMQSCARLFLGEHDWTAFSAAQSDVQTRVRTVTRLEVSERWSEEGRGRLIEITASADGFLRYMVRSIAGTLLEVGRGEMDERQVARALDSRDRSLAGATAPAKGLTLVEVHY